MTRLIFVLIITLLFTSCGKEKIIVNRDYKDIEGEYQMTGRQTKAAFLHENYANWYKEEYDSYKPNPAIVEELKKKLKGIRIKIYYGSWCGDSRREVPRFLKILEEANFRDSYLEIYAVNKKKESFYGEEIGKNILYVPTFIFYSNKSILENQDGEMNRIIESPSGDTLEEDILKIISLEPYTPNYYH